MKFLVDNQLPPALARLIQSDPGADAMHVADIGLRDATDAELWSAGKQRAPAPSGHDPLVAGRFRGAMGGRQAGCEYSHFNGKTWLNEGGEIVSHAKHVEERFTPAGPDTVNYEATVVDPAVYTQPWTIAFPLRREKGELIEFACHQEDRDISRLKRIRDAAAGKK